MIKRLFCIAATAVALTISAQGQDNRQRICISTDKTDLILEVDMDGRLNQAYLGEKLLNPEDLAAVKNPGSRFNGYGHTARQREVFNCSGNDDYYSPALGIVHADGNRTTYLYYQSSSKTEIPGGTRTDILLQDKVYPVSVTLHYEAYTHDNIIISWADICHREKGTIRLAEQNSPLIYFQAYKYYLTEFTGDWGSEARMSSQELRFGKKTVDTKLGSRANLFGFPFFEVGFDSPAAEDHGNVLLGTIGWIGNWRYTLEVDSDNMLCVSAGLNPTAADYELEPGVTFTTPQFIFTYSTDGVGSASRDFHDWARQYRIKNGQGSRLSLLNNWENTFFDFDEDKLGLCMREGAKLGVDLFLLDDGWFGNGEDARNSDRSGLGDWEVNHAKLPQGVPGLVNTAREAGIKFGIWIEPEMVNPQSKLFREHKDWALLVKDREMVLYRNQVVLDFANPKVQDFAFSIVDNLMKENPEIAFFKWDCNAPITNIYSPYEKKRQGNLYYDHARGVLDVMKRVAEAYPDISMMMCSGGGARCDYESLRYFTEFWCSDNTDPFARLYIQWGYSHFFPVKTLCDHVTSANRQSSVKFRVDVAMMGKLGFDIGLKDLSQDELTFCNAAVNNWRHLAPAIMDGDMYRLVSPYESDHMALNYVSKDKGMAVLFSYDIRPKAGEQRLKVKLQGLDPRARYKVTETNLMPGAKSNLPENGQVFTGDYLMKIGLESLTYAVGNSRVIELVKE